MEMLPWLLTLEAAYSSLRAGKGPSEFYYSWIPVVAPFVGGCAAAGLYAATELMNNSDVPAISFPNLPGA